jgi:hypothetical protein
MYIRLDEINRALGYSLYDPPTLAGHGPHGSEHMDKHIDEHEHDNSKETDDVDHLEA